MKKIISLSLSLFALNFMVLARQADPASAGRGSNRQFSERYKENADLSYTSPLGEIGAPGKYILNGRLSTVYMAFSPANFPVSFAVIPDFTVRVRGEESAGVRTPSFRLSGVLYARLNNQSENYRYAELKFTHHSNGQDASFFNPDKTINTYNGNFSANSLTLSYRLGFFTSRDTLGSVSFNHRAGLEWYKWFSYEPGLQNDYGFTRLLYNFSFRRYSRFSANSVSSRKRRQDGNPAAGNFEKESLRINTEISYAINKMPAFGFEAAKKRLNAEVALNYSFPFMNNVFLMLAGGYYGEDPYNIYYRDHYAFVRTGISTGFIRYKSR